MGESVKKCEQYVADLRMLALDLSRNFTNGGGYDPVRLMELVRGVVDAAIAERIEDSMAWREIKKTLEMVRDNPFFSSNAMDSEVAAVFDKQLDRVGASISTYLNSNSWEISGSRGEINGNAR